ncbi:serine hydrolase [Leuconostocaceae bacterium ESL0723]|nr:serine hydrolase [Leuconostocaceae bacterium ESL0723]
MQRVDLFPASVPTNWTRFRSWLLPVVGLVLIALVVVLPSQLSSAPLNDQDQVEINHNADYYQSLNQSVAPEGQLGKSFDQEISDAGFRGTALIVHHNRVILQKGYGYANDKKGERNQAGSFFQIASVQKGLTAALVVRTIEAGKLSYQTKLSDYYPQVPNASKITIRDLLTMTSGLRQVKQPRSFESEADNVNYSANHVEVIGQPGDGHGWTYQAVNYRLLAGILMKIHRQSFDQLFYQTFNDDYHLQIASYKQFGKLAHMTQGYGDGDDNPVDTETVEYERETGTGNVAMTTGMLYRFYRLIFDQRLVKHPEQMWQNVPPATYASGVYQLNNFKTAHGIFTGYEPSVVLSEDGKDAVILLSNQYNQDHTFEGLSRRLFQEMTNIPT